ncbi:rhamnan synthesis F family protein [Mycobacterium sp. 4858]|uniref:rhamnan synthesis F family protein n=1 Tax=Mycobacterium sp. 4858 TaxID=2057185 RepID=UPI0013048C48|nr:rhamnan synthesis F family protein [Mycobacterium sp. 4858]
MKVLSTLRTATESASAAARYRRDGEALRFVCETHQELSPQPPAGRRTLVLFAHFDPEGIVDPYVAYYLKALHGLGATIIFVSGSPALTPESVASIRHLCAGIYTRRTLSLDFGSWHLAWCILRQHGWSLDQFDRFVIANDSVYGPLFPIQEMWNAFHDADMYGPIENAEWIPHLQSFFVVWDLNSRTRPFLNDFWTDFRYLVVKGHLIWEYEVGLSRRARQAGLRIKTLVSPASVKAAHGRSPAHQWAGILSGGPVNNTLYFWDGLIEHLRFPFLKAKLPRQNKPWHDSMAHLGDFIQQHTAYPYELIESNLDRLGCGPHSWVRPSGYAVLANRLFVNESARLVEAIRRRDSYR